MKIKCWHCKRTIYIDVDDRRPRARRRCPYCGYKNSVILLTKKQVDSKVKKRRKEELYRCRQKQWELFNKLKREYDQEQKIIHDNEWIFEE